MTAGKFARFCGKQRKAAKSCDFLGFIQFFRLFLPKHILGQLFMHNVQNQFFFKNLSMQKSSCVKFAENASFRCKNRV